MYTSLASSTPRLTWLQPFIPDVGGDCFSSHLQELNFTLWCDWLIGTRRKEEAQETGFLAGLTTFDKKTAAAITSIWGRENTSTPRPVFPQRWAHLFHWLLVCMLSITFIISDKYRWSIVLNSVSNSNSVIEPSVWSYQSPIYGQSEVEVTTYYLWLESGVEAFSQDWT